MNRQIIHGEYTDAVIYTVDNPAIAMDEYAAAQLRMICSHKAAAGSDIRVMPDVHPGKVGPIGLTMTIHNAIMPQLVGIDIGCGMTMTRIRRPKLEYPHVDSVIREHIPSGFRIHSEPVANFALNELICAPHIRQNKALCSLGTLGGGNHFIEIDHDEADNIYIIIHSGSRHLGKEVCEYYCREGQRVLKARGESEPFETTWLDGDLMAQYLHDAAIVQDFAQLNRETILKIILKKLKWKPESAPLSCSHNYIDMRDERMILRKGAISAQQNEPVIIPIHMKDGIILGTGRGNPDWNMSAPHGSGRLYKREEVRNLYHVSAYKKDMAGIYSSCINSSTLDESPFCYRDLADIQNAIADTVQIEHLLKPLYNYKDSTEE